MRLGDGGEFEMRHKRSYNIPMRHVVKVIIRDESLGIVEM